MTAEVAAASVTKSNQSSLHAALLGAALMIVQQVGAKATRDAFFLSNFGAEDLPRVMIAAAVLSILGTLMMARALVRFGPANAVLAAYATNAVLFAAEWFSAESAPRITSVVVYLHLGALGPLVVSGFWSLVNERFDPHTAKRYITRIAASAAFGGAAGGLLAERITHHFPLITMLPILACLNASCAVVVPRIAGGSNAGGPEPASGSALTQLRKGRYLRNIAFLVLAVSTTSGLLDYALKAEAAARITRPESLASFFAVFHASIGVAVFLVQSLLSGRALNGVGIGGTLAALPALVALSSLLSASVGRLWTVILTKALEATLANSLFRSGYELLYTPVAASEKRALKTLIDVGVARLGDIAAAGLALLVLWLLPAAVGQAAAGLAGAISLTALALSFSLHRGYVSELAASLRAGTVRADDIHADDATTERTLTDTTIAMDRDKLLAEIRSLQANKARSSRAANERAAGASSAPVAPSAPASPEPALSAHQKRTLERVHHLLGGDPEKVAAVLAQRDLEPELIPYVITLLGRDELARAAIAALRALGAAHAGQLTDALLDTRLPVAVRRRTPRVLCAIASDRARDGLLAGLLDPSLDVRLQCARGLQRLCRSNGTLAPDPASVYAAVARETSVISSEEWTAPLQLVEPDADVPGSAPPPARVAPRLQYVIALLSTVCEPEPLQLCLQAFAGDDASLRGTALEYLENVLPKSVYSGLERQLAMTSAGRQRAGRQREQIIAELHQSVSALVLEPGDLQKG
jgi:hypothetical protein